MRLFIFLITFFSCSLITFAQQIPERIRFEHFTVAEGLPENSVTAMLQDHLGFVWLGTQNGLIRYDGTKLTSFPYHENNPTSLKGKLIKALLEDHNGDIWIAAESLFRYERSTQRFIEYPRKKLYTADELNNVVKIYEDKQGFIWTVFGYTERKARIERLDPKTKRWTYFINNPNETQGFAGESISLEYFNVGYTEDKSGKIWVITVSGDESRLYYFDLDKQQFIQYLPNTTKDIATDFKQISGLVCDREGQLLFSSIAGKGLFRLNPVNGQIRQYINDPGNSNSLIDNVTSTVYPDKKGNIWVSTRKGLDKLSLKNSLFTHYVSKEDDPSTPAPGLQYCPLESADGNIWFITYNVLSCYQAKTNAFIRYEKDIKNEDGLSIRFGLISTMIDRSGLIWVGTDISGLNKETLVNKFSLIKNDPENPNSLQDEDVTPIYEAPSNPGLIWFGTKSGLESYDQKSGKFARYQHDEKNNLTISKGEVVSITEDKQGRFWVATRAVLHLMDRAKGTFKKFAHDPLQANSLMHDYLTTIKPSADGKLWIGTSQGLDLFDPDKNLFTHYYKADTTYTVALFDLLNQYHTPEKRIAAILHPSNNEDKTVEFSLSSTTDVLVTGMGNLNGQRTDYGWIENDGGKIIWDMVRQNSLGDGKGHISAGIIRLAAGNYKLRYLSDWGYAYGDWSGPPPHHSELWGIQLAKLNAEETAIFSKEVVNRNFNGLSDHVVFSILEDSKNNLLIGTNTGGITRLNRNNGKFSAFLDPFNGPYIVSGSILEEKQTGNYWVGDYFHGLLLMNQQGKLIKKFDRSNGLSSNTVFGIIKDPRGILWISTNNGICRFDPVTEKIIQFNDLNGLQGQEFNPMSFCSTADGQIYFGGLNGVNAVYPGQIKIDTIAPKVVLTDLDISGKPALLGKEGQMPVHISIAKKFTLKYDQNDLTFHFTAIHYTRGEESRFAYRLSPNDKDWIQAGSLREVRYTNLSPGTYTFTVKAANADGIWNETGTSVTIVILPPWWKTWWAYTLYLVALISSVLGFIAYRSAALRKENKLLENKVELRTNELKVSLENLKAAQAQLIQSEKMASLGELTSGIAHEIQNPLNFVNNFSDLNAELIEEMKEEIVKGNMDEINALAADIGENEKKINQHGKRAEAIVKGMLEHSRSSSGVKSMTDINKLTAEYFRLAYHGIMAKDQLFHVAMNSDYDETIGQINIVSGDIGKVILNLVNNAFYAVSEQKKSGGTLYEPAVSVSTKKSGDKVFISVKDNGTGIPPKIVDKIFQPFFTTKPTGNYTGLGLSLSYDIVKAHGGDLSVETMMGEGAEFIIALPFLP